MSIRKTARRTGLSRNTVKKYLRAGEEVPRYAKRTSSSKRGVDATHPNPGDRDHMLAYLESSNPKNIPLYERHGFELLGTIQVGTSPPIFPMLRTPRR
jgi:hypothetical protein